MIIKTGRFGSLTIDENEIIKIGGGLLGLSEYSQFCLVDPGDETLILWLQSLDHPDLAFPVLEPKIFKSGYIVRLSALELKELDLKDITTAAVFSILTIPEDVTQMTANLKAPVVINLTNQKAKQVVLQENEYQIKQSVFKELRTHLLTIQSNQNRLEQDTPQRTVLDVAKLAPSHFIKSLS